MAFTARVGIANCSSRFTGASGTERHVRVITASRRLPRRPGGHRGGCLVRGAVGDNEADLDSQVEAFMKEQAAIESGYDVVQLDGVVGDAVVPDEDAKAYCRDIVAVLEKLRKTRDMEFAEVKLTVAIDDPTARDRRAIGIEDESGASRDEIAAALVDVNEGRIPKDRIALKVLWQEMTNWPALDSAVKKKGDSGKKTDDRARPPVGRDENETPQSLEDMLPEWVGYSFLYVVSAVPIFIGVFVVFTLFVNSLQ